MIDRIKQKIVERKIQVSLLNDEGLLQDSCHTHLDLRPWIGQKIDEISPIFGGLTDSILALQEGDPAFVMPFMAFSLNDKDYELNIEFFREPGQKGIIWLMSDNQEFKYRLQQMQQQRNNSMILLETIESQKKMLAEANERLESMNQGLDRFAYIVSHDLKSPLRAIGMLSEWIGEAVEEGDMDEFREHLKLLKKRSKRMENLIEGILHYSRAGRARVEKEEVDVNDMIAEIIESNFGENQIKMVIPQKLPQLLTMPTSLYQVFSNLISNAVKYNDKELPEVTLTAKELDGFWEFTVADNGPGIAPRHHELIFEIFGTLQSRDSYESTGIGLTIVQKIVEDVGGTVRVESELGSGATFTFTWPR